MEELIIEIQKFQKRFSVNQFKLGFYVQEFHHLDIHARTYVDFNLITHHFGIYDATKSSCSFFSQSENQYWLFTHVKKPQSQH